FTLRIRGRGPGRRPLIENVVEPASRVPQQLLPLSPDPDSDWQNDLERLLEVILASGAFPYAFPPVWLGYCLYAAAQGPPASECSAAEHADLFIDGGVFDNVPLRLASALTEITARPGERTLFIYLDPDLRAYPLPADGVGDTLPQWPGNVFIYGAQMAGGFVQHARKTELFALLEERPAALDSVLIATSRYPPSSGFLANFLGLFEGEFRRFDFYLGMSDALHDLESWEGQLPSQRGRRQLEALWSTEEWRPLRCLRSWIEPADSGADADCATAELRDLRVLTQIAVNRVYNSCRALSDEQRRYYIEHTHCRRAAHDSLPPEIVNDPLVPLDPEAALRRTEESELGYNLRLLGAYGFHFRDLGVPPEQAHKAHRVLARRLREVLHSLAKQQPERWQASLVSLAALGTVDAIHYDPPPNWGYLVMGTAQELGFSYWPPGVPDWLRLNGAFRVEGIVSLLTQDPNKFAAGLFGGPDLELRPFTRSAYMITLAGRVGYQFSAGDRFLTESCNEERARGDGRDCSQVVLQAVASLIAIERVRFQVTLDYFTRDVDFDDRSYDVHLAFGVQF
ncbi:MAG: patatin-like phospholipase family protein, partial [Gemmatimonadota bacterium]